MFECSFFFSSFLTNFDFLPPPHHHHPMLYILYTKTKKLLYVFPLFFFILKFEIFFSSFFDDERRFCVCVFLEGRYILAGFFFCLLTTTNCTKVSRNQIFFFKFPQNPECVFSKYEKHELTILKETHTCTDTRRDRTKRTSRNSI